MGHAIPGSLLPVALKLSGVLMRSLSYDTDREPGDRFGYTPGGNQNLNDQSYGRVGFALLGTFGPGGRLAAEVGYNRVVWGRSARIYNEPYVSVGVGF